MKGRIEWSDAVELQEAEVSHLPPLTFSNLKQELAGLREDMLNWDHGHPMD